MIRNYLAGLLSLTLLVLVAAPMDAAAQQKTTKQCNDEYAANKAAIQASGKKKADFVAECKAGQSTSTTGQAAAPASGATAPKTTTTTPAPTAAPAPPKTGQSTTALAAGQFATESQAKANCPGGTVVWANLDSKIYHFSTSKDSGNTKHGAYMCEKDTAGAGFRAAKNEKHP